MKYILGPMRLPFLILGPACVFLGLSAAIWTNGRVNAWYAVLAFVGGICAHISVNALNDYSDIKSGLDLKTTRTPFSGGSGTLTQDPTKASYALWTGIVSLIIISAIGVFFSFIYGWPILAIGALGIVIIVTYTNWLNKIPVLCLIAPGVGFGTLMVVGTFYVLTGSINRNSLLASFIPFFLVSNLLLLNQFPDADVDKTVGRRHLPIMIGKKASAVIYAVFTTLSYVTILLGVLLHITPAWTLIALASIMIAIPSVIGALKNADDPSKLLPAMGQNVLINILAPVLMGIGFLIG